MIRLKKWLRIACLIILILLACFGIGIGGTPPVLPRIKPKFSTEYVENQDQDEEKRKKLK